MSLCPLGLFDQEIRQRKLESLGDPLVELDRILPRFLFREMLEAMQLVRDTRRTARSRTSGEKLVTLLAARSL